MVISIVICLRIVYDRGMSDERLDRSLVLRGLVSSRERAQRLIEAGLVLVDGVVEKRSKKTLREEQLITVLEQERYVSRGGYKLESALEHFKLTVEGLRCLDVGASTGGFTDCLLQHGAHSVLAVDVGHGQLAEKLGQDSRVESREGINVREWHDPALISEFSLVCVDVSFISLKLVLGSLMPMVAESGHLILLIKPQFEVGRMKVGKGGIVKDEVARQEALDGIKTLLSQARGWNVLGNLDCPVEGKTGNREFLLCAKKYSM